MRWTNVPTARSLTNVLTESPVGPPGSAPFPAGEGIQTMKRMLIVAGQGTASTLLGLVTIALLVSGCEPGPKSAKGFRLPDGNAEKGKAAFVNFQCNACHTVQDVTLPPPTSKSPITVALGGEFLRVRTYGDLVTSLINPTHIISEQYKTKLEGQLSPMPEFNETMTVAQMIDLVSFLQPHYKKLQIDYYAPVQ